MAHLGWSSKILILAVLLTGTAVEGVTPGGSAGTTATTTIADESVEGGDLRVASDDDETATTVATTAELPEKRAPAPDPDPTITTAATTLDPVGRALVPFRSGCYRTQCPPGTTCIETFGRSQCVGIPSTCDPNPCLNGGGCVPTGSTYTCSCRSGFSGAHCEVRRKTADACFPNPCLHGGSCHVSGYGFQCSCLSPYYGARCESERKAVSCYPNPCLNGGVCSNTQSSFWCACSADYYGVRCDHRRITNACRPNVCLNGGLCRPSGTSYQCDCVAPFHGAHCEHGQKFFNPCSPNPCLNGGICTSVGGVFSCFCTGEFSGRLCDFRKPKFSVCSRNPCLNGGTCLPSGNSYRCQCSRIYSGAHCELSNVRLEACSGGFNPCNNMCECVKSCRHASGYYCRSNNGYLGKNCTIPPPNVQCQPSQVVVTVDDAFVREYDLGIHNSRLHMAHTAQDLAAPDCFATTANGISHTFNVPLPFTKCGTIVETRGGKTVVTNNIWLNRATAGGYDMPVPVICFECTYEKEYVIVASLQPAIDQPPVLRNVGIQRVQGVIELCKVSSSCPGPCPSVYAVSQGAVYTVGEMIHLNIRGDASQQSVLALKTLHLSCDGAGGSPPVVQLVTGGCPGGAQNYMPTIINHSGQSSSICVSFQVPRLQGCASFYIHAEVQNCGATPCQSTCFGQPAQTVVGRKRRSQRESVDKALPPSHEDGFVDIFGPIYFIKGSYGIPKEILFPNTSIVDTTAIIYDLADPDGDSGPRVLLTVGMSVLCVLIVLTAIVIAVMFFRFRSSSGK